MADNPHKRALVNRAHSILVAGRTTQAGILFESITDAEFANWASIKEADEADKRLICCHYESILKQVIEEIDPDFARKYADLGHEVAANMEYGGWEYLFEFPADYLSFRAQVAEGRRAKTFDAEPILLKGYSHVVCGSDDQAYVCAKNHTSVDDADDGQPPDNDGSSNWTLYDTDGSLGAAWYEGMAYKTGRTAWVLGSNTFSNEDGDAAYIRYSAYVQTAADGTVGFGDDPRYYPEGFKNAFATRLAAEIALDSKDYERRRRLLEEYEQLAKPACRGLQQRQVHIPRPKTVFERRITG